MDSPGRIGDPKAISLADVERAFAQRGRLVVQFSRPETYSPSLLHSLNLICAKLPDTMQVRFYGHSGTVFDAKILGHLPMVKNLSLDCLTHIQNEDAIADLPHLRRLTFGVREFSRPDFLNRLNLSALTALSLHETRKRDFDLAPLAKATALTDLNLQGHCKGFDTLAKVTSLKTLHLGSIASKQGLAIIGKLPSITTLSLLLGGRENLDELASQTLVSLQVLRVKGLTTLGNLSRLPALRALRFEDQLKLTNLDLAGPKLERLHLFNCKSLSQLDGLDDQNRLQSVFISKTSLDMDALRDRPWPESLRQIQLLTSRQAWNDSTSAHFGARGIAKQTYWEEWNSQS